MNIANADAVAYADAIASARANARATANAYAIATVRPQYAAHGLRANRHSDRHHVPPPLVHRLRPLLQLVASFP